MTLFVATLETNAVSGNTALGQETLATDALNGSTALGVSTRLGTEATNAVSGSKKLGGVSTLLAVAVLLLLKKLL